jgi:hypothetical protein
MSTLTGEIVSTKMAGELFYGYVNEARACLAGVARAMDRSGGKKNELKNHLIDLPSQVDELLPSADEREYSFGRDEMHEIVSKMFHEWEITNYKTDIYTYEDKDEQPPREKHAWLITTDSEASRLLVDAAADNVERIARIPAFNMTSRQDRKDVAKLLVNQSPEDIERWFELVTPGSWAAEKKSQSPEDAMNWMELFAEFPHVVKWAITHNPGEPLKSLNELRRNLTGPLSDKSLSIHLNCSVEEVRKNFSLSRRIQIATHNVDHPEKAILAYKTTVMRPHMFYKELSQATGLSLQHARFLVPVSMIKYFAERYDDPLHATRLWLAGIVSPSDEVAETLARKFEALQMDQSRFFPKPEPKEE